MLPKRTRKQRKRDRARHEYLWQYEKERLATIGRLVRRLISRPRSGPVLTLDQWLKDGIVIDTRQSPTTVRLIKPTTYCGYIISGSDSFGSPYYNLVGVNVDNRYDYVAIWSLFRRDQQYFTADEIWEEWRKAFWLRRIVRRHYDSISDRLWRPGGPFFRRGWEAIESLMPTCP